MPLSPETKDRLRLVLAAAGVAIIAIPVIIAAAWFFPRQGDINWKWARFAVVTIFLVVYCMKTYWRARKHLGFWGILLGILILHFVGVGFFFYAGPGLPLLDSWLSPCTISWA